MNGPANPREGAIRIATGHRHYSLITMLEIAAGKENRLAKRAIEHCRSCRALLENAVRIHGWAGPMVEELKGD